MRIQKHFLRTGYSSFATLVILTSCLGCSYNTDSGENSAPATPAATLTATRTQQGCSQRTALPFDLTGICGAAFYDASAISAKAPFSESWHTGGDWTNIISFPLDKATAFGSHSSNPNSVSSYVPALIHENGDVQPLAQLPEDLNSYVEPQDGTATTQWIVWRSASINDPSAVTEGIDNWQVSAYNRTTGETTVIAQAKASSDNHSPINAVAETVPVASEHNVFIPAADGVGNPLIEIHALPGSQVSGSTTVTGRYPAAIPSGMLYAPVRDAAIHPTTVAQLNDGDSEPTTLTTLKSEDNSWFVGGIWSNENFRSILVTNSKHDQFYLGVWRVSRPKSATWFHTTTPVTVVSLARNWIAWGSGSSATQDQSAMYLVNLTSRERYLLGRAPGYSRPMISTDGSAILIPSSDGRNPVSWTISTLPDS